MKLIVGDERTLIFYNKIKQFLYLAGIDLFCEIISILEDHYPETLKKSFIINGKLATRASYRLTWS